MIDKIVIRGARANNLKNVDLEIPRDRDDGIVWIWKIFTCF